MVFLLVLSFAQKNIYTTVRSIELFDPKKLCSSAKRGVERTWKLVLRGCASVLRRRAEQASLKARRDANGEILPKKKKRRPDMLERSRRKYQNIETTPRKYASKKQTYISIKDTRRGTGSTWF